MLDIGFLTSFQIPGRREDHISRPDLVAKLESRSATRLQVVVAPAAYGKTTLLGEFAQQSRRRICWFTIEESDADVGTFLRRVHSSVRAQFPRLAPLTSYSPGSPDKALLRSLVVNLGRVGRRRVTPVARSTFPSAPLRTGRAAFTASGSPVVYVMTFSTVSAFCIMHTSLLYSVETTCPPSPCGRLSRPRTTTRTP